jgi:hypothetical protein
VEQSDKVSSLMESLGKCSVKSPFNIPSLTRHTV